MAFGLHYRAQSLSPWSCDLLSWDSSAWPGQLTGRRTARLSTDVYSRRPLPRDVPVALRPAEVHSASLVPSLWFCTTSTASSAWRIAGLLHPAAGHEVRCVSCSLVPNAAGKGGFGADARSPQRDSDPSKDVPRRQPFRVTAVVAFLPLACRLSRALVPPRCQGGFRARSRTVASASRRCSVVGSVARPRRCRRGHGSVLPWASFPFKVLADDGRSALLPPSTEPWPLNQDSKLRSHTCGSATSPCRLQAPRPVARKLGSTAPVGPVPGPRAQPPKRPRRARSARADRRSGKRTPRTGRSCTEVHDRGTQVRSESLRRFTRERVYAARHTWRPKPMSGDQHPRLLVGWPGAFEVCPELKS
jgi:hypothetical protein